MSTKRDEVREFIKRKASSAIADSIASMQDREAAEKIRVNRNYLASQIAFEVADTYPFLELADIMEWKRTRVRR